MDNKGGEGVRKVEGGFIFGERLEGKKQKAYFI